MVQVTEGDELQGVEIETPKVSRGKGYPPPQPTRGFGGASLTPQQGLGRSPSWNWIWWIFDAKFDFWWDKIELHRL